MQPVWKTAPLTRLVPPVIFGIVSQQLAPVPGPLLSVAALLTVIILCLYEKKPGFQRFSQAGVQGAGMLLLLFFLGRLLIFAHTDEPYMAQIEPHLEKPAAWIITLENDPFVKTKKRVAEAGCQWLINDSACYLIGQRILVYLPVTDTSLQENDVLICRTPLLPIERNPASAFDFKAYCARKHIQAQLHLRKGDYRVIGTNKGLLRSWLHYARSGVIRIVRRTIPAADAAGLLEALLIGYSQDLDKSLVSDYNSTGVVHIIAISGLHLALIYSLLQFILQKLGDRGLLGLSKTWLIIAALWTFSLLCGASPSVLRSAIMLTLTLTAKRMTRDISGLNGLAAAALLLLAYNPWWLWDLGFQLSFLAVLSLLIFARRFNQLIILKNKMLAALWNAASVSLAAQILTTPVCLFYFHQFPNYFLPTNLIAVPLSSLVLLLGMLTCSLAWSLPLSTVAGSLCAATIRLLNGSIHYFSSLPHAIWHTGVFSLTDLAAMYLLIWCCAQWLIQKKSGWLLVGMSICLLWCVFNFCDKIGLA